MNTFKRGSFPLSLIAVLILIFGCNSDKKPKSDDADTVGSIYSTLILGNWSLKNAFRNGKKISSLDNTIFEFQANGNVLSNFNMDGIEQNNSYTLKKDKISQSGQTPLTYLISEASDTTLTLTTRFRGYSFKLELGKWKPDSTEE